MEEGHVARGGANHQAISLRQRAERDAIASDLPVAVRAIEQPHFDDGIAPADDRQVAGITVIVLGVLTTGLFGPVLDRDRVTAR